jgi:hypothetical protein
MSAPDKASLAFRCVDLQAGDDVDELRAMVERSRDISFETFARNVDWKPLAQSMGYAVEPGASGMRLDADRGVAFHSSSWRGESVYYLVHSAIEFVYRRQDPSKTIHPADPWGGMERVDTSARAAAASRPRRARP